MGANAAEKKEIKGGTPKTALKMGVQGPSLLPTIADLVGLALIFLIAWLLYTLTVGFLENMTSVTKPLPKLTERSLQDIGIEKQDLKALKTESKKVKSAFATSLTNAGKSLQMLFSDSESERKD